MKQLAIWNYTSKTKNLEKLAELKNLQFLKLTQPKLISLQGIKHLKMLNQLEIYYSRGLSVINELKEIVPNLKRLELEVCKKITDYEPIGKLTNLEYHNISNCGDINSIHFIKELKHLKYFNFWDTNVLDGDLNILKNIERVHFNDKKQKNQTLFI